MGNKKIKKIKIKPKIPKHTFAIKGNSEQEIKMREAIRNIIINDDNIHKSDLHNYFINNTEEAIFKHLPYFDIYERYFSSYRGKDINLLEIGVGSGGSSKMWKEYFSKNNAKVNIYGIDINEKCKQFEQDGIKIFIGSQSDREFLRYIKSIIPKVDILIDDAGHVTDEQIVTFEELYDHVKDDGIYWCEDIYTSYWPNFNGGYRASTSFIEYTKNLIDYLHASWAIEGDDLEVNYFTNTAYSIHYYDGIIVIEKKLKDKRYTDICQQASIGRTKK